MRHESLAFTSDGNIKTHSLWDPLPLRSAHPAMDVLGWSGGGNALEAADAVHSGSGQVAGGHFGQKRGGAEDGWKDESTAGLRHKRSGSR